MAGTTLKIPSKAGDDFTGYLALPESKKGPGVVIIQEIFGVNPHIKSVADLYAAAGFVALAPDIFWRAEPNIALGYDQDGTQKGIALVGKVGYENMVQDLTSAVDVLKQQKECTGKVAAVGYCLGGALSYRLACADAVDAAVCYYGGRIADDLDKAGQFHCPVMMHFGEKDTHIPMATVDKIKNALAGKGHVEVFTYDADHGFNCDARASYDRNSAMLAYGRTQVLLSKALS